MITDLSGKPYAPAEIRSALKAIDERLDIIHVKPPVGSQGIRQETGTWAYILRWPEDDKRRARIRSGELPIDADYDYLGEIPFDCPVDQARTYFETYVRRFPADVTKGVQEIRERVNQWNVQNQEEVARHARELGLEMLDKYKGDPDVAASMGVETIVTKPAGRAGAVAQRTGRTASELALAMASVNPSGDPVKYATPESLQSAVATFVAVVEGAGAATTETIEAVAALLLMRGAAVIAPPETQGEGETAEQRQDFASRMAAARAKKAAESAEEEARKATGSSGAGSSTPPNPAGTDASSTGGASKK